MKNNIFRRVFNFFYVKCLILKLEIFNLLKSETGINKEEVRNKKIIISLTTYPKRLNIVHLTIETLLNQEKKPDKIILYLSNKEINEKDLSKKLLKLKKRGLEIRFVDENLKSYKKLIYALREFPNDIIITTDDDTLYPNYFIKGLYKKYLKYKDCIIGYRCSIIEKKSDKELMPYLLWKSAKNIKEPSYNIFFTGVGGVLYPPKALHNLVFDKSLFMRLAPTGDDIWFKAMSLLNNTKAIQVFENPVEFPLIRGSQDEALWKLNNEKNHNDKQLKQVFDYFDLYKLIS